MTLEHMRVGMLTQWYDPEPGPAALPGVLARGLAARGHDVQVVTGFPNYPTGHVADGYPLSWRMDEHTDGVRVRRVPLYPSHDASSLRRAANYGSFGASAAVLGTGAIKDVDALWVNYSPITTAGAMWIARYAFKVPLVVHVLDLWPDTLLAGGFAKESNAFRTARRALDAWCQAMYRSAATVAYISPGVGEVLQARGVPEDRLEYVPMWADEDVFRPVKHDLRRELGINEDHIVLLYAGALGEAQGLESLIEACARVRDPRFLCLIAGSGVAEEVLKDRANSVGTTNVKFIGRVPQTQMTDLMATTDISYVGLRPHPLSPITMPSKTQAALASGRPLLVAAWGDVARVAIESGAGITANPEDPGAIAAAIEHAVTVGRAGLRNMGENGRRYYERTFSVAHGVGRIESLLAAATGTRKAMR